MSANESDFINYARQLSANCIYSKAIDVYLMAFEKNSNLKQLCEVEFRTTISKYNQILAEDNRIEDVLCNFSRAIEIFPDNIYLLNDIGRYLFHCGLYEEAWNQFQQALSTDSGFVSAERNVNSVKNVLIERWHFRMLNDKIRNETYRTAINEIVVPNKTRAFDLGTGTGLLAMYASESNPRAITACDSSKVMTTLTDHILEENKLRMVVEVINKMSTLMDSSDVESKCSLLITELFDAGLFGEHILQSLSHAWTNLLLDKADIIPKRAEFFVMGIDSELLHSKYQLCQTMKCMLNIRHVNAHIMTNNETYDCEDVHFYKDVKYMTEPQSVIKIDFTDINDINEKLYSSEPIVIRNKVLEDGKVNTYIGWFKLYLTENICLTTDPRDTNRANAWQQAVFYDSIPRSVQQNETYTTEFFLNSEKLTLKENDQSFIIKRISPETLRFLNDTEYMKLIKKCVGITTIYLGQTLHMSEINIIDLNPFPLYGFFMLQRGIQSLTCYAKNDYDKEFIETVFCANRVDMHNVTILIGDIWSLESLDKTVKFNVVFVNTLELCGDIDLRFKEISLFLKNDYLMPGGLFMPWTVTLMGQIVNSYWLDITNRVYDENVGYKVSNHINKFQVSQNFNLDYAHLEYTPLTDPVELGNCRHLTSGVVNTPVICDGEANAILCWYKIELMERLIDITTKRPYSFIDGIAFLANPIIPMVKGSTANILRCVDSDGLFKLIIDVENT